MVLSVLSRERRNIMILYWNYMLLGVDFIKVDDICVKYGRTGDERATQAIKPAYGKH